MLDQSTVNQYDSDIFREALNLFVPDSKEVIQKIELSTSHDDLKAWAHRIKGSFLMIGANTSANIARKIEESENMKEGIQHLDALKSSYHELIEFIKKEYQIES